MGGKPSFCYHGVMTRTLFWLVGVGIAASAPAVVLACECADVALGDWLSERRFQPREMLVARVRVELPTHHPDRVHTLASVMQSCDRSEVEAAEVGSQVVLVERLDGCRPGLVDGGEAWLLGFRNEELDEGVVPGYVVAACQPGQIEEACVSALPPQPRRSGCASCSAAAPHPDLAAVLLAAVYVRRRRAA